MILTKSILILEDNLLVLSKIIAKLELLEQDQPYLLSLVVLTDYQQVEDYINNNPKAKFDIVLLDRDCKLNGSFHNLNIEKVGAEKVISISTVDEYNEAVKKRGVKRIITKDLGSLDKFTTDIVNHIKEMISTTRFNKNFNLQS